MKYQLINLLALCSVALIGTSVLGASNEMSVAQVEAYCAHCDDLLEASKRKIHDLHTETKLFKLVAIVYILPYARPTTSAKSTPVRVAIKVSVMKLIERAGFT